MTTLKDSVNTTNLGALNPKGRPQIVKPFYPGQSRDVEGDTCITATGRKGRLTNINGRYVCRAVEHEEPAMSQDDLTEAVSLRFQAASRTQIGKQHQQFDVHQRVVQGLGNVSVSPIQGRPGAWFFLVSSPSANQYLDPKKLTNRMVTGVTVSRGSAPATPQAASGAQRPSVKEKVQERVAVLLGASGTRAAGAGELDELGQSPGHEELERKGWRYDQQQRIYKNPNSSLVIQWHRGKNRHFVAKTHRPSWDHPADTVAAAHAAAMRGPRLQSSVMGRAPR